MLHSKVFQWLKYSQWELRGYRTGRICAYNFKMLTVVLILYLLHSYTPTPLRWPPIQLPSAETSTDPHTEFFGGWGPSRTNNTCLFLRHRGRQRPMRMLVVSGSYQNNQNYLVGAGKRGECVLGVPVRCVCWCVTEGSAPHPLFTTLPNMSLHKPATPQKGKYKGDVTYTYLSHSLFSLYLL